MRITVIVPTFNESDSVGRLVERIEVVARQAGWLDDFELLFVDDSDDDTPEKLAELSRRHAFVRYIHRMGGRGLGTAVVEGFRNAAGEYLVVMDADLQHPPELLPRIIERLERDTDVVVPSRFVSGGSDGGLAWWRKLVSWTARWLGRLAIRRLRGVSDCTGGYFGIRREVITHAELRPVGWKILIEVLVQGQYETLHEIPYRFVARAAGESKMSLMEQWNYVRHLVRLVGRSPEDRRFYLFCFVGFLGTIVNLLAMAFLVYVCRVPSVDASILASLVAMTHNFLWNDRVTWRGHAHAAWKRIVQVPVFVGISLVSVGITAVFVDMAARIRFPELVAQCIGIVVATVWSFIANNRWTWSGAGNVSKQHRRVRVTHD